METITMADDKQTDRAESVYKGTDEDLMSLFDQYSDFKSPTSDWLSIDIALVINETSSKGISVEYAITVQQCTTTTLFDTDANMSVILQKFFNWFWQQLKLLNSNTCTVTSASGTDLGLIEPCYITVKLGNKCFVDKFIF